ncbi:MAG TPA: phosphoglycerate kinase [Acidimicrobiales bacterium]|nr:phosphoglycerate kinase [Acidimicrobiales bacterium]
MTTPDNPIDGLPRLEDLGDLDGKRVLVRTDWNVPLDDGRIVDDLRITASRPTLQWLSDQGAQITVATHLGRPKGQVVPELSTTPLAERLQAMVPGAQMLENLRFDPGETANDPATVDRLTDGQDLYVNDAFGVSHRAHASVVGPPSRLPSAAGRLLFDEVEVLGGIRSRPRRPFVVALGGSKVSDKLGVIEALVGIADSLVIGGGMCFTFLAAQGHAIGSSLFEPDHLDACGELLASDATIHLPTDLVAMSADGKLFDPSVGGEVRQTGPDVPDGWAGFDIGPETAGTFADIIAEAGTVLWNGPMGAFEDPRFVAGTRTVAEAVAETHGYSVIGGGDSNAAIAQFGLRDSIDHASTGGGASLELLEFGDLPGLRALREAIHVR